MRHYFVLIVVAITWGQPIASAADTTILVEAESFSDVGGWVIDQQFADQMGSPFLLAHGLGKPVVDALTTVVCKQAGQYRVWVRTRDWVGPWKTPNLPASMQATGSPGKFQVRINGQTLGSTFGVKGAQWHWQDGGIVQILQGPVKVVLHDLMGFDGRCDAILLTTDMMGEVVGMAASLCNKHTCDPRAVYHDHLAEFRRHLTRGVPGPAKNN